MRLTNIASLAVLSSFGISTEIRLQRLAELDLTNIKRKLMEPVPEGKGWTAAQCDEAEKWYKRYLAVMIKYPEATRHVPNRPIDDFWHQHILDTRAYARDCQHVMGEFLHHYPYFGLNGDAEQRDDSFDQTNDLYIEMFGEPCTVMVNTMKAQCGSSACQGGGTCRCCTVDGDRAPQPVQASNCSDTACESLRAAACDPAGTGTSCGGHGCSGGKGFALQASKCSSNDSSSGNSGSGDGSTDPGGPARRSMQDVAGCQADCGPCTGQRSGNKSLALVGASNCNSSGSGTGCGQGCSRGNHSEAASCGHGGGTGCGGRGCSGSH